ncbi:MAG: Trm112 family protein [Candidatus Heimdallarchaeota archaeon]
MKLRLLDILVCPLDKEWPLKVHIFEDRNIDDPKIPKKDEETKVVCRFYCVKKDIQIIDESNDQNKVTEDAKKINYDSDCKECLSKEIVAGMIMCPKCSTLYPIIDEIPLMLKAELRNEDIEKQFSEKWSDKIKELMTK